MGREPPAPPTEAVASEGKAAPPAVPQSKWDQVCGWCGTPVWDCALYAVCCMQQPGAHCCVDRSVWGLTGMSCSEASSR